jgi:recombination protein RecT
MSSREVSTTRATPAQRFKAEIAHRQQDFAAALPAHIPPEKFVRVVQTAVISNPALLNADRTSLIGAAMKAAQDGLLPDGRESAFVLFKDQVSYMPMVAGILKKVRNSGELLTIAAHVVYENDDFTYALGDDERIEHRPLLKGDRGKPVLVYAIAKTKGGGVYREVMTVADVERVRNVSRAKGAGPWVSWWSEMARKTVIRRLAKRLPMSTDLDQVIRRDDELVELEGVRGGPQADARPSLADRLNAGASGSAGGFSPEFVAAEIDGERADADGVFPDDRAGGDTIDAQWEREPL